MVRKSIMILCLLVIVFILVSVLYVKLNSLVEQNPSNKYLVHNTSTGIGYFTVQEALDAPETSDGNTISVEAGIFHGHTVIRKAVHLIGHDWQSTVLDGDGNGTVVSIQSSVRIDGFTIRNGSIGIAVDSSSNGRIVNSNVQSNEEGIHFFGSNNWTISENLMTNNYASSLVLNDSDNNIIYKNEVSYNRLNIHDALELYNSSHNVISDNSLINNRAIGILLRDHSSYSNVSKNLLMNNLGGIELVESCNYNTIEWNSIIDNETMLGLTSSIWIRRSQFNTVYANEITSNRTSSSYELPYEDGVGLSESTDNTIVSNNISLMDTGVGFHFSCENNSVIGNTITRNGHGIDFTEGVSNRNTIYSNNLIENTEQVHNSLSTNTWDDDYPITGNYWSDYETRYPNATEKDSSGIWDTPYVIDPSNADRYPLKSPITQYSHH
jgi:parallel beta-helix repeat protein